MAYVEYLVAYVEYPVAYVEYPVAYFDGKNSIGLKRVAEGATENPHNAYALEFRHGCDALCPEAI